MADSPYTQDRKHQFRGPTDSADYNQRIEENRRDLVYLYNGLRIVGDEHDEGHARLIRDHMALTRTLEELKGRIASLEADTNTLTFFAPESVDTDEFVGTPYEVDESAACTTGQGL